MPIVKQISIHAAPKKFLEYIVNGEKTDEAKFVSGINISSDANKAYKMFKMNFEKYSDKDFSEPQDLSDEKKKAVRLHHYVQSFSPDDNISAEEAHQIGIEWAKKVFGENTQIIVSTHVDRAHIHNHFAVAAYDMNGKHWHSNEKTLSRCRRISDKISLEHGIGIIEPKHKNSMKYAEWLARQNNSSVKEKIQYAIDKLILDEDVKSIDDLAEKMRKVGYEVKLGKFMTVRPPKSKRAFRTESLDKVYGGYSIAELQYRISNKHEMSESEINKLNGLQHQYALYVRQIQIIVFRKKSKKQNYKELISNANLLTYLCNNDITSVREFENKLNEVDEKYNRSKNKISALRKRIEYLSEHDNDNSMLEEVKQKLSEEEKEYQLLAEERKNVSELYKRLIRQNEENRIYDKEKVNGENDKNIFR